MSDLTQRQTTLEQSRRSIRRTGSLRDVLTASKGNTALLCDVSGSMEILTRSAEGRSRIGNLIVAVSELPKVPTIGFGYASYDGDSCRLLPDQSHLPTQGQGGTPLAEALELAKIHGYHHVVVVTDGQPNDAAGALLAARGLKVDAIYVADPPMPQFMYDLCNSTGGSYSNVSIDDPKQLESAIRGLLGPAGSPASTTGGIKL